MPKKILILMSDTGGGHRASAEAIAEAMARLYGDEITVRIVDAWRRYAPAGEATHPVPQTSSHKTLLVL